MAKRMNLRERSERKGTDSIGVLSISLYSGLSFGAMTLQVGH